LGYFIFLSIHPALAGQYFKGQPAPRFLYSCPEAGPLAAAIIASHPSELVR
jgi:hypothetical protein